MPFESIPLIGAWLSTHWGPALETLNHFLDNTPVLNPRVTAPLLLLLALLLLWELFRIRFWRRKIDELVALREELAVLKGEKAAAKIEPAADEEEPEEEEPEDFPSNDEIEAELAAEAVEPVVTEAEEAAEEAEAEEAEAAPVEAPPEIPAEEPAPKLSLFARLKAGLSKTSAGFVGKIDRILTGRVKIDEELYSELEEALFTADVGVQTAGKLLEGTKELVRTRNVTAPAALRALLKEQVLDILKDSGAPLVIGDQKPFVIMVVGVNGVGKTTTIGKIASKFAQDGKSVIMAAGDTFRAAAIEQLEVWAQRAGSEIVKQKPGADPSAVAFDAVQAAKNRGADVVIVDTAGRLHTKSNLMEELKKTKRVMGKIDATAPHETLLVLDATTGQNAIAQAKTFHGAIALTGIILTKLDGTSKGGCIVGICDEMRLPIRYIGIGEKLDDLRPFVPGEFVDAMFDQGE